MRITFTLVLLLLILAARAQTVYISTLDTLLCKGQPSGLELTTSGTFGPANDFNIQLSDANGNFASPTVVATFAGQVWVPGTAGAFLVPLVIPTSGKYRMRVVTDDPVYTSPDYPFNIRIDPMPATPIVSNNSPVCVGDMLNLQVTSATGGLTHTFSGPAIPGGTQPGTAFNLPAAMSYNGIHYISVQPDSNTACVASTTTTVVVKPRPAAPVVATDSLVACEGDHIEFYSTPANPGDTMIWEGPNSYFSNAALNIFNSVLPINAGLYIARSKKDGCYSQTSDTLKLTVIPKPGLKVVHNSPLCEGDTLIMSALDTLGGLTSFSWTGPDAFSSIFAGFIINSIEPVKGGKYYISASHQGCIAKDTIDIVVFALPALPIVTTSATVCEGRPIVFSSVSTANPFLSYEWTGPNGFIADSLKIVIPNAKETSNGSYVLKVSMEEGCSVSDTLDVEVKPTPDVTAKITGSVVEDATIELTATSDIDGATYQWSGPRGFSSSEQNPKRGPAMLSDSGNYVVVASYNGCSDTSAVHVKIGDGTNYTLFEMHPNPTGGEFFLTGRVRKEQKIDIGIYHATSGIMFYEATTTTIGKTVNHKITLPGGLPYGVYVIKIKADGESNTLKFVLMR